MALGLDSKHGSSADVFIFLLNVASYYPASRAPLTPWVPPSPLLRLRSARARAEREEGGSHLLSGGD